MNFKSIHFFQQKLIVNLKKKCWRVAQVIGQLTDILINWL